MIVHGRRARAVSAVAEANSADSGQAEGLTADLAAGDLVSSGIVVTPGVRESYRLEVGRRSWGEDWPAIGAGVLAEVLDNPAGRPGRPEEVADLVAFIPSPLADYIYGANLRMDGGSTAVV